MKIVVYNQYFKGWEDINGTSLMLHEGLIILIYNNRLILSLHIDYVDFIKILNDALNPFNIYMVLQK